MGNTLQLMILFSIFFGVVLLWHQLFKISTEESMVLTSSFLMLTVLGSGILKSVFWIYPVMGLCGVAGIITFIFNISIKKIPGKSFIKRIEDFLTPGTIVIFLIFGYCVVAFRRALFTYPDEYFQWGNAVKFMYNTHRLPYGSGFTGEDVTLSMATMFQYYWCGLGTFVESNAFIGNFLLAFIGAMLPFSGKGWKHWKETFLYAIILFLSLNVIESVKYYNLLQDFVLPLWAGGMIAWALWRKQKISNWPLVVSSLIIIGAMKSLVGPLFACIVALAVMIVTWIYSEEKGTLPFSKRKLIYSVAAFGILVALAQGINWIWGKVISQNVLDRGSGVSHEGTTLAIVWGGMVKKIFESFARSSLPYISYVTFFALAVFFVMYFWKRIEDKRTVIGFRIIMPLYIAGFILYLFVMLYAYCFVFGTSDSISVAGLERYLAYYMLLGVPCILVAFLQNKTKYVQLGCAVVIALMLIVNVGDDFLTTISSVNRESDSAYTERKRIAEYRDRINQMTEGTGKIFLLGEISSNEGKMLTYELGERLIWNQDCYKMYLRQKSESKVYVDMLNYPELLSKMAYQYVLVLNKNELEQNYKRFQIKYEISNIKEGDFYELVTDSQGIEQLQYRGNLFEKSEGEN